MATEDDRPTLSSDIGATLALALYSAAVAAGFARVFSGWEFLDNLLLLVIAGHGAGLILRRLKVSAWIAVPTEALTMLWVLAAIHYRSTFSWGLPTNDTWSLFTAEVEIVQDQFSIAVAPVTYGAGWDVLAAIGLTVAVLLADVFAFHALARAEALVPGGVLFVFVGALGSSRERVPLTVALIAAGIVATIVLRAYHAPTRPSSLGRKRSAIGLLAPSAIAVTIVVALAAGILGPQLPGAEAAPIYETRGGRGGVTEILNPLVDIRSRLTLRSDTQLFVVQANQESYWRSSALPRFSGTTWDLPERPLESVDTGLATARQGSVEIRQQVRIVNLGGSLVPAAADPVAIDQSNNLAWEPGTSTLTTTEDSLSAGDTFTITSASPRFDAQLLTTATSTDPGDSIYFELPDDLPAIVAETAAEVTAGSTSSYDAALTLQNWFRNEFTYSLDVQPGHGNNAIESFLREHVGYCEQFAGTYAAMIRTLGVPSRVAVGFTSGTRLNDTTFSVLGKNAHAWPEVWFDGLGWVPFEPTPGRGAPGAEDYTDVEPEQDLTASDTNDTAPGSAAGDTPPRLPDQFPDGVQPPGVFEEQFDTTVEEGDTKETNGSGNQLLTIVLLLLLGAAVAAPAIVRRWRTRDGAFSTDRQLTRLWLRSLHSLEDAGVTITASSTPLETAATTAESFPVAARPMRSLAEVVTEATYRPGGTEGYEIIGAYGSSTIRDCANWNHQIERAVNDSISGIERIRRYFTRLD